MMMLLRKDDDTVFGIDDSKIKSEDDEACDINEEKLLVMKMMMNFWCDGTVADLSQTRSTRRILSTKMRCKQ